MSTDRELLELAAKAAGLTGRVATTFGGWDRLILDVTSKVWQPLHDDGDALRLAVRLKLDIAHNAELVFVGDQRRDVWHACELHGDDPFAATRRAIVRAAAEIGSRL